MLAPSLISATPFRNRTAWRDMCGVVDMYHQVLTDTISRTLRVAVLRLPLGDGDGGPAWLDALTRQHVAECQALAIDLPTPFTEYNLADAAEFASFTFQLANDLQRIRIAAGVV